MIRHTHRPSNRWLARASLSAVLGLLSLLGVWFLWTAAASGPARADTTRVGLVTSEPVLRDFPLDWMVYQGILRAEADLGVEGSVYTSTSPADYERNLLQCASDGNRLCLAAGVMAADAISRTAAVYTHTLFAIADAAFDTYPDNLRGIAFAEEEVGYLAGTLAAWGWRLITTPSRQCQRACASDCSWCRTGSPAARSALVGRARRTRTCRT